MAITLSAAYLAEIKKSVNQPDTVLEVMLDSGVVLWGFYATTPDVRPILKDISSLQNKLDIKTGYLTRGQMTFTISGRNNFKSLIANNYMKNRRVNRKDGFLGISYADYVTTYTGKIIDWSRKGDNLTITVSDDMIDVEKKIPTETESMTQYIDYTNMNPVNIMTDILLTQLSIGAEYVDSAQFDQERERWLNGWIFSRVITEPKQAANYLHELQTETNSFIVHDGEKISYKVFAPLIPGEAIEEWSDDKHIIHDSFSVNSGYKDQFYNRVIIYYDYDESGSDDTENYESVTIDTDTISQSADEWGETSTKTINSKWIRSYTFSHDNISGIKPYHISAANEPGTGEIAFTYDANGAHSITWTPPRGSAGEPVTISKNGKYQVYGADTTKYIRVLVTYADLPEASTTGNVVISAINGRIFAATLARKILSRYRDPAASVTFQVGLNNVAHNSTFIKPTDYKDITTDEACRHNRSSWTRERIMLTSVRPDTKQAVVDIEGIETKFFRLYGFIAPAGYPDYAEASPDQRQRAFIGDANNKVNGGTIDGYYIW